MKFMKFDVREMIIGSDTKTVNNAVEAIADNEKKFNRDIMKIDLHRMRVDLKEIPIHNGEMTNDNKEMMIYNGAKPSDT
jgi:hypothetical protein